MVDLGGGRQPTSTVHRMEYVVIPVVNVATKPTNITETKLH